LNDLSAIGAMRAGIEAGLRVPADFSVVGVDDIPLARFLPVSLATIAQPLNEMARQPAAMLIARIEGDRFAAAREATFSTGFVARESIGPAATIPGTER
jgi:LacI family transcriptional regulator